MTKITYTIQDQDGIHARPAGLIVKKMKEFQSNITLACGKETVDIKKLFALMGLGAKQGDIITVTADGIDELAAIEAIKKMLMELL